MKTLTLQGNKLVIGPGSLKYLEKINSNRTVVITGGNSMFANGTIDTIKEYLHCREDSILICAGVSKNPTKDTVEKLLSEMNKFQPDLIIAVGGGSAIDAAKAALLFYEYPDINFDNVESKALPQKRQKTTFIAIPSTSGTGSEVTHVTVITYPERKYKVAIRSDALRPDIAILDAELTLSLPPKIAAETGMDALTHAIESYINKNGDEITQALTKAAILGIIKWLPTSYSEGSLESRQKLHIYQCMAGMGFANSGLGMVHGVSHAFGGIYDTAHGLSNAVILPYAMEFNGQDMFVHDKFAELSMALGEDVISAVKHLSKKIGIPACFKDIGITESEYMAEREQLVENSMGGSTKVNPIAVEKSQMYKFVDTVYYGI